MEDQNIADKFVDQKSKLIELIEQEIIDSKVKLKLLQYQLEAYQRSKQIKNKKQDKSIQVCSFENIGVQVDQNELNKENNNCHCNRRKPQSSVCKTIACNEEFSAKNHYVNREKQYFDKVNKIKKAVQKSEQQCIQTGPVVKQNLSNKTNQTKMLRSIAVETTFSDELNLSILDQTIYLNLPDQLNVRRQKMDKIEQTLVTNPIANRTFTIEDNSLEDCIQRFNDENQIIHKTMFENQIDLSSRSSTPKKQSKTNDSLEKNSPPIEVEKLINFPTFNYPIEDHSLQSFERTNNLSALTTFNVTALDHQQFWKEIFDQVGLEKN